MSAPARVSAPAPLEHEPAVSRRAMVQAGAVGLLGLGMNHVAGLRAMAATGRAAAREPTAKAVIYIFLSGGLAQHDSFDMKPDAPDGIRGEFRPIATRTPGIQICEHLPLLAQRAICGPWCGRWPMPHPEHSAGHLLMLSGRSTLFAGGFDDHAPKPTDWPSIAAVAGAVHPPAQQPAAGGRAARDADSSHGPIHPRPVRRHHGGQPRPDGPAVLPV